MACGHQPRAAPASRVHSSSIQRHGLLLRIANRFCVAGLTAVIEGWLNMQSSIAHEDSSNGRACCYPRHCRRSLTASDQRCLRRTHDLTNRVDYGDRKTIAAIVTTVMISAAGKTSVSTRFRGRSTAAITAPPM